MVDSRHGIKASTGRPALLIWTVVAVAGLAALVGIGTRHALQLLLLAKPPPTADPQPHVPEQATPSSLLPPGHAGCAAESEGWKWGTWEAHGCTRLQRVCVDDAAIILTDAKYQQDTPKGRRAGALPVIKVSPSKAYVYPWRSEAAPGPPHPAVAGRASQQRRAAYEVRDLKAYRRVLEAVRMRPITANEPRPYLQSPTFSTCTVPILFYSTYPHNMYHAFEQCTQWHTLLQQTSWRHHVKPVVVTPEGLAMPPAQAALMPVLSPLSPATLADFSSRLPAHGFVPGTAMDGRDGAALSYEGGEQRCFRNILVCSQNIRSYGAQFYEYGQAIVKHEQLRRQQEQTARHPLLQRKQPARESQGSLAASSRMRTIHIRFIRRLSVSRQLTNMAELVQSCNAWQYRPPNSTLALVRADCTTVTTPDLAAGVAAAQEADVLVGMHGADLTNAWLMRPGSSVVEVLPYQFKDASFSYQNAKDPSSRLLWWRAAICDPALSTPGPWEVAKQWGANTWARDRSALLPWAALEALLQQIVAVEGDFGRYKREFFDAGMHQHNVVGGGAASEPGPQCPPPPDGRHRRLGRHT